MGDTYTIMRVFAGSWGLLFMFTVFIITRLFISSLSLYSQVTKSRVPSL